MAELTESQKYELGIAIHKWQKGMEGMVKNGKPGDVVVGELMVQLKVGINEEIEIKTYSNGK